MRSGSIERERLFQTLVVGGVLDLLHKFEELYRLARRQSVQIVLQLISPHLHEGRVLVAKQFLSW